MADSNKRKPRSAPQPLAPVEVQGVFLERVTQIPAGAVALLTTLGTADGKRFLVPFVDISLTESIPVEADLVEEDEVFGRIVTLDNAVYLLDLLANELAEAFSDYEAVVNDKVGPEPGRFQAIGDYLSGAEKGLSNIRATLKRLTSA